MEKTIRIDDIDGSTDEVHTVQFALGKDTWEIDLSRHNQDRLTDALTEYIAHARRVRKIPKRATNSGSNDGAARRKAIRQWATDHGHNVSPSGKIPDAIVAAYEAATSAGDEHQ